MIEDMDISGLNLDDDLKAQIEMHMRRKVCFALASLKTESYVVFLPHKLTTYQFRNGNVLVIKSFTETEFHNTIKMTIIGHRRFIPAGLLVSFIETKNLT